MKTRSLLSLPITFTFPVLALFAMAPATASGAGDQATRVRGACSSSEQVEYSNEVTQSWRTELNGMLSGKYGAARGFSNALSMRRTHPLNPSLKTLAEYWISRSLYEAKMVHVARIGFQLIAQGATTPEVYGIQLGALECLSKIGRDQATFETPAKVAAKFTSFLALASHPAEKSVIWDAVGAYFREQLSANRPTAELKKTLGLLRGSGAHESFARLAWSAKRSDHGATIEYGKKFIADASKPKELRRFHDQAHLLIARALYSTDSFDAAAVQLKLVQKKSNELAKALSELTWAYLMNDRYAEAIGTAMNLQAGGLRHTFAPEAPMVMGMALNEICQFPESLKAVNSFRKFYEKPFRWLERWSKASDPAKTPLYGMAVEFINRQGDLPVRIGSEWIRTPYFIAHQGEINLLFDERDSSNRLGKSGAKNQRELAMDIQSGWKNLKLRIQKEKQRLKPGEALPTSTRNAIADLRYQITVYRRFLAAAPAWRTILATHLDKAPAIKDRLVKQINSDLAERTLSMYTQLQEIAENNQLIEVEIYSGASQDIIWQNAHPEYKKIAQQMKEETQRANAGKIWDWGRAPAMAADEAGEVWEDELGSFKAELFDNCSSKDKYLKLWRQKS